MNKVKRIKYHIFSRLRIVRKFNVKSAFVFFIIGYALLCCEDDEKVIPSSEEIIEADPDTVKPVLLSQDFAFDSIKLSFSEPIELLMIKSTTDVYDLLILNESPLVRYAEDSTSIKFRCVPCQLGQNYELTYTVKDTANNISQQPFVVDYYSGKLKFPVRISDYLIDDKKNVGYVLSIIPNRLSVVSLTNYTVAYEVNLDFLPAFDGDAAKQWRLTYNPFNGYFYFFSTYSKSIFVYSLEDRALVKSFELPPDNLSMPEYSSVYPRDMAFTASGQGLINTVNQWGNGDRLRIINSTQSDATQLADGLDAGLMFAIRPNGDYSKVFLISEHAPFYYFDSQTNTLSQFSATNPETNFTFFVPNRMNDLVYMSGHQAQFIIDHVSSVRTPASYIGLPVAADFSYGSGEEKDFAYLVDNSKLWLLNYKERKTEFGLMIYDIDNVESLVNTVDGKTMIIQLRETLYFINLTKLRRRKL